MKGTVIDDRALVMAADDTVATALADLAAGERLAVGSLGGADAAVADTPVTLAEDVPFGHKVALVAHEPGDPVRKYGEVVGEAATAIEAGEWVHTHNCDSRRGRGDRAQAEPEEVSES